MKRFILPAVLLIASAFLIAWWIFGEDKEDVVISSFIPQGEIQEEKNIEITFSKELIPVEKVGLNIDSKLIEIRPDLDRACKWHSQTVVRCYIEQLKPGQEYSVEVSEDIVPEDAQFELDGKTNFKFKLSELEVLGTEVTYRLYYHPPETSIKIDFSQPVNPDDLKTHLKIYAPDGSELPFSIRSYQVGKSIEVRTYLSDFALKEWKYITMEISKELPTAGQLSNLVKGFEKRIDLKTGGILKIAGLHANQSENRQYVSISFSSEVDSEKARPFITIDPEVDIQFEPSYRELRLVGRFEPGDKYTVTIHKDLISSLNERLEEDFTQVVSFPDLSPTLSLIGSGHYLPRTGKLNLGIETVNLEKVHVKVKKIFPNNLVYFLGARAPSPCNYSTRQESMVGENIEVLGKEILNRDIEVEKAKNRIVTTTIPVNDLMGDDRKGIYAVMLYKDRNDWRSTEFTWLIATDLGIIAKKTNDRLMVMVRSIETLEPVYNARVKLLSRNNQDLAHGRTDYRGIIEFTDMEEKFREFDPYLILASFEEDLSFLNLDQAAINTSSFDVGGDSFPTTSYEAYIYPDRDIFRPGETAHMVYIIRDKDLIAPVSFPVRMEVMSPDNRLYRTLRGKPGPEGAGEFALDFPVDAMTGAYPVTLYGAEDKPLGYLSLRVEEFMPDRMKVKVNSEKERYGPGEEAIIEVQANYLFGPPVVEKKVSATCDIQARTVGFKKFSEFTFYNTQADRFENISLSLGEKQTDENGQAEFTCSIPPNLKPPSGLNATLSATVTEPGGGRAVTGRKMVELDPYPVYIGLKRVTEDEVNVGDEIRFETVAVGPHGEAVPDRSLKVRFYKREWYSILKRVNNRYGYVSEYKNILLKEEDLTSGKKPIEIRFSSTTYGRFIVEVEDSEGASIASMYFYTWGWGYAPWAMSNPDRVEMELDRKEYMPGDVANILVKTPFSGKLILMIERERVLEVMEYDIAENTADISVPVKESYRPNSYITATLIRSFKSVEKFAPVRAFGAVPLKVSSRPNRLDVEIDAPMEIRPNTSLEVTIKVPGARGKGRVTLAAVDEGILQLTSFQSPDPLNFFFRKRRLMVSPYDMYSLILPEVVPIPPRSPFGGGLAEAEERKRQLIPLSVKRVKPVSMWSGIVDLDERGRARISFDVPQFSGSLRLMASAFSGEMFGAGEMFVRVRDPITITSSFPRFLAPGDSFIIPVTLFNGTGKQGEFKVSVVTDERLEVTTGASMQGLIENERDKTFRFEAKAPLAIGKTSVTVKAEGNGEESMELVEMAIRPPYQLTTLVGTASVQQDKPARFNLPGAWVKGTEKFKISVSSLPVMKFAKGLQYLLGYPYGCIEQTTSRVFPLLYFGEIARIVNPDLFEDNKSEYYVNEGIIKIESMLLPEGYFSYWPWGRYHYPWSSIYATHFLVEAKKAGYNVSDFVINKSLRYMDGYVKNRDFSESHRQRETTYALYVLALAGKPNKGVMDYLMQSEMGKKLTLDSKVMLAGAYALSGDMQTAEKLMPYQINPSTDERETGYTFNSGTRSNALMLSILVDVKPDHAAVPVLVKAIADSAKAGMWYTTQENSFAFLALGKYFRGEVRPDFEGEIEVGGRKVLDFDREGNVVKSSGWSGQEVLIEIEGKGTAYVYWEASGIPTDPPPITEEDRGIEVRRRYLDEEGNELDPHSIQQGTMIVAEVNMRATGKSLENVFVVDMLPAGLEIENPRLQTTARIPWLEDKSFQPQYIDIRDDRIITFQNLSTQKLTYYYALRAVTAGNFVLPSVKGEAMYDPSYQSISSSGRITVVEGQ